MLAWKKRQAWAGALATVVVGQAAMAAVLSDDFGGAAGSAPDAAMWTVGGTPFRVVELDGQSNVTLSGGVATGSHRGLIISTASDFDPFTAPITIDLDEIDLLGTPDTASFRPSGFVSLGLSTGDNPNLYVPTGGGMHTGVSVFVRRSSAGGYDLQVRESILGAQIDGFYGLNAAPTGLTLTVDGASRTLTLVVDGTTFTSDGATTAMRELNVGFTAANMSLNGDVVARVALGSFNQGTMGNQTGSTFVVGAVHVVPEPAAVGLLAVGLLTAACRRGGARRG